MDAAADRVIGATLREERRRRGVSQEDVARSMGQPQSFVSKVEHGMRGLRLSEAPAYAQALGMDLASFVETVERAL